MSLFSNNISFINFILIFIPFVLGLDLTIRFESQATKTTTQIILDHFYLPKIAEPQLSRYLHTDLNALIDTNYNQIEVAKNSIFSTNILLTLQKINCFEVSR